MDVPANQWYIILHVKQTLLSIGYGNSRGIVPIIVRSRIWESLAFRSVSQAALSVKGFVVAMTVSVKNYECAF